MTLVERRVNNIVPNGPKIVHRISEAYKTYCGDLTHDLNIFNKKAKAATIYTRDEKSIYSKNDIMPIQAEFLEITKDDKEIIIAGVPIRFNDEVWDLTSLLIDGKVRSRYLYDFHYGSQNHKRRGSLRSEEFNIVIRLYVLYSFVTYGVHCGSIHSRFTFVKTFLRRLEDEGIYSFSDITEDMIKNHIDTDGCSDTSLFKRKTHTKMFLSFYHLITNTEMPRNITIYLNERDQTLVNAHIEEHKTKLLPSAFYEKYTDLLYKEVFKEDLDKKYRGFCGLVYIDTQTGLRSNELLMLKTDSLCHLKESDIEFYYLNYRSTKNVRGDNSYTYNKMALNEKTVTIFNYLIKMFEKERIDLGTDKLLPNPSCSTHEYESPDLKKYNMRFAFIHAKELDLIDREDADQFGGREYLKKRGTNYKNKQIMIDLGLKEGQMISYPSIKQFRVYVSTDLHNRGVSARMIAYMLGHKTEKMIGYYTRAVHPIQEDIDFSKEVVREIVSDDLDILGAKGIDFKNKIDEIIAKNGLNVEKDLESIIDKVCDEMPIRAKLGGFCVKSNPKRECRHDADTDEFMCAYGCCPNHCHLYYALPDTYKKCLEHKRIIEHNLQCEFINSAQKAANVFKQTITHDLQFEIEAFDKELKTMGKEAMIAKHPELTKCVDKIKDIKKEIKEWMALIEKTKNMS